MTASETALFLPGHQRIVSSEEKGVFSCGIQKKGPTSPANPILQITISTFIIQVGQVFQFLVPFPWQEADCLEWKLVSFLKTSTVI